MWRRRCKRSSLLSTNTLTKLSFPYPPDATPSPHWLLFIQSPGTFVPPFNLVPGVPQIASADGFRDFEAHRCWNMLNPPVRCPAAQSHLDGEQSWGSDSVNVSMLLQPLCFVSLLTDDLLALGSPACACSLCSFLFPCLCLACARCRRHCSH